MARYRKKHHSRGKTTLPIAIVAPVAAVVVSGAKAIMEGHSEYVTTGLTGYGPDGKFHVESLMGTYGPIAAGAVVHYAASRFGVNRALGRAKVPLIRI
jgi:hypothetical protein